MKKEITQTEQERRTSEVYNRVVAYQRGNI